MKIKSTIHCKNSIYIFFRNHFQKINVLRIRIYIFFNFIYLFIFYCFIYLIIWFILVKLLWVFSLIFFTFLFFLLSTFILTSFPTKKPTSEKVDFYFTFVHLRIYLSQIGLRLTFDLDKIHLLLLTKIKAFSKIPNFFCKFYLYSNLCISSFCSPPFKTIST